MRMRIMCLATEIQVLRCQMMTPSMSPCEERLLNLDSAGKIRQFDDLEGRQVDILLAKAALPTDIFENQVHLFADSILYPIHHEDNVKQHPSTPSNQTLH